MGTFEEQTFRTKWVVHSSSAPVTISESTKKGLGTERAPYIPDQSKYMTRFIKICP